MRRGSSEASGGGECDQVDGAVRGWDRAVPVDGWVSRGPRRPSTPTPGLAMRPGPRLTVNGNVAGHDGLFRSWGKWGPPHLSGRGGRPNPNPLLPVARRIRTRKRARAPGWCPPLADGLHLARRKGEHPQPQGKPCLGMRGGISPLVWRPSRADCRQMKTGTFSGVSKTNAAFDEKKNPFHGNNQTL